MEIQEWDEPQCFDEDKNNDTINSNDSNNIKHNTSHKKETCNSSQNNGSHTNTNYTQRNTNNNPFTQNSKYYNCNNRNGNAYYIKKQVYNRHYNHTTTTTTANDYNYSSKANQQYYNNKKPTLNMYSKQSVSDNYHSQTHNNHYIYYPSHHTNQQFKSYDTNNTTNTMEINNSNGTILYCPPQANKNNDIITIKPYQTIPFKPQNCIRIIALGCTHELHNSVFFPNGDLLIHAGDICNWRRYYHTEKIYKTPYDTWKDFTFLLNKIRNKTKDNFKYGMYIITGNHDKFAEQNTQTIQQLLSKNNIHLLINKRETININNNKTLSIFGSPISWYRNKPSNAYQIHRNTFKYLWNKDHRLQCNKHWDYKYINQNFQSSNILAVHGPCAGFGDCEEYGKGTGSYALLKYIKKTKPKLFICSDFHGSGIGTHGYGISFLPFNSNEFCICMNVAIAHTKARYMRAENVKRGVVIYDMNMSPSFQQNKVQQ